MGKKGEKEKKRKKKRILLKKTSRADGFENEVSAGIFKRLRSARKKL